MKETVDKSVQNTEGLIEQNKAKALLGFRTNKIWKKVISISYLIFCVAFAIIAITGERKGQITSYDYWIDKACWGIFALALFCPYIFLSNTKFRDKLPLFKKHSTGASIGGLLIVFVALIVVFGVVDSAHSAEYKADMKNHAYTVISSKDATCETDGEIISSCDYCGKENTEIVAKLGHKMTEITRKEATENEDGQIVNKCSVCGKEETITLEKEATAKTTEKQTELITETTTKKELNSVYSKLTDKQFALLTEMMAKSFYSFSLSKEEHKTVESDSAVMSCLTQIYSYAYDNYFELDPEYKEVFATKHEVVSKISNYETLKENFAIEYYFDNKTQNWVYTINSYSLNKNDVVEYDDKLYIDAEGYLNKGVIVYWLNDGVMEASGEIKDTAYNKEINGTTYAYAVNIEYYDDPYASGWTDGEIILRVNKNFSGKPLYYVNVQDANRKITREEIDFSGTTVWKPLKSSKPSVGTEVYSGITHSKSYVFTIVGIDISSDSMLVSYPSGTTEYKSYSAIMNNEYLFVKL